MRPPIEIERIEDVTIAISDDIRERAETAIAAGGFISEVKDDQSQELAIAAIRDLKWITSEVEKARKECKKPFLEKGRELDRIAKEFSDPIIAEQRRINGIMTSYTVEQNRIRQEAERKRQEEIRKAEEEKRKAMEAVQKAKSDEEKKVAASVVAETIAERKEVTKSVEVPARPQGIQVRKELRIEVEDAKALLNARPDLCEIVPKLALIKAVIKEGNEIPGVKHWIDETPIVR